MLLLLLLLLLSLLLLLFFFRFWFDSTTNTISIYYMISMTDNFSIYTWTRSAYRIDFTQAEKLIHNTKMRSTCTTLNPTIRTNVHIQWILYLSLCTSTWIIYEQYASDVDDNAKQNTPYSSNIQCDSVRRWSQTSHQFLCTHRIISRESNFRKKQQNIYHFIRSMCKVRIL